MLGRHEDVRLGTCARSEFVRCASMLRLKNQHLGSTQRLRKVYPIIAAEWMNVSCIKLSRIKALRPSEEPNPPHKAAPRADPAR